MILLTIAVLVAIFAAGAVLRVNLGLLGLAGAFLVGTIAAGIPAKEVLAGFPTDIFVTLVGITYLFALARSNGTIDLLVDGAARLLGHRAAAMPLLVFSVSALLTALGALGPAAVAIIAPVALRFARQYRLSPLMMGLVTIHGAQAGAFSPMSIYGGIANQVMARTGVTPDPIFLFLASLIFNALIAACVMLLLGRVRPPAVEGDVAVPASGDPLAAGGGVTRDQLFTLGGLVALATAALALDPVTRVSRVDIGLMAICVIIALAALSPQMRSGGLQGVDWSTALLICGIVTYVTVMARLGVIDRAGASVALVAAPLLASLLLCYLAGVVSAFASSTALLGVVIPLAAPLFGSNAVDAIPLVAAIAVSTTIVDTSPFSTNGALVVANAAPEGRAALLRQLLIYSAFIIAVGPLAAWAAFVVGFAK